MDSPKSIADGMLALFNTKKKSDVETFMVSALSGFAAIPGDLYALTKDFLDSDHRWDNETDRIRLISLLKKGATSDDLRTLIKLVVEQYFKRLSEEQLEKLLVKMGGSAAGSFAFKYVFVNEIVSRFFSRVIPKFLFSAGMTGIITIGASVSSAIYTSRDLMKKNREVYAMLRGAGDLDLLYFLLQDNIDPWLDAIALQQNNSPLAQQVFSNFLEGIRDV
ncbi:hypothetical protein [Pantoea sp. SM3]|uniref:hypothetical protein n=1 Tax=Pantoea sp. SM3 TaxID=1628192 RepID=UPI0005F87E1C|nr:hypothetical protein [Pantoea sp. SM3]KJV35894.1 hypothetical protein VI01_00155 [Pantoea sp. SM3]